MGKGSTPKPKVIKTTNTMNYQPRYSAYLLLIFLLVFMSCEKDLKTEVRINPKLCFNCILNPDSVIRGSLSLSQSISENNTFQKVSDAIIELKEDGQTFGIMKNTGSGVYVLNIKPNSGSYYEINIKTEGFQSLHASTIVPLKPSVNYELDNPILHNPNTYSSYFTYRITKNINDRLGINRYWHYRHRQNHSKIWRFVGVFYDVDSPIVDNFNRVTDATDELGFHYESYIRINDSGMDGAILSFYSTSYLNEINFFIDTDEHYDKYLKSTIKQKMNDGDNLLFNEPVQIYSNIENGLGIFGSAAITSFKL
ncbi:MAG TPA: hypothetical protein DHV48_19835 [Prolixibacteraceae bacterium]|nr:MAG: hypothetical protein A2066_18400 [Bacteroidetes bacterium GWB2_41_8]HCY43555.1 hypothetical protein [Prolixibacteraceae bacterium]